jgi:hypothetical protein
MQLVITPFYAGLLGLMLITLAINAIRVRMRTRVSIGDGGDAGLAHAIRAHGNFVEYAPMGLILMALVEMQGAPALVLHMLGAALVLGRAAHAWGLTRVNDLHPARGIGMMLTFAAIALASVGLIAHAVI